MFLFLPLLLILTLSSVSADSPCTDQLQRCGVLVEEFERQLHDLKNLAFRNCFTKTACVHEKIAFDECFTKSLLAVRAPFNAMQADNDFLQAAEAYRPRMEQCFTARSSSADGDEVLALFGDTGSGNVTITEGQANVAHLAPVVYGTELIDRLWGLPMADDEKDPEVACSMKESGSRLFGGGISRIAASSSSNTLNMSCTLGSSELTCYRQLLDRDPQHRLLVSSRDKALHSCLHNIRLQSEGNCQFRRPTALSCICNAREELDNRMQSAILDCVQHSSVAQLYSALNSVGQSAGDSLALLPAPTTRNKPAELSSTNDQSAIAAQIGDEPISVPSAGGSTVLSQGTVVNGQCLCACPQSPRSAAVIAAASNDWMPRGDSSATTRGTVTPVLLQQQQQPQVYRPLPAMPWYYQPVQTALSAEAGIASGFERFFNGQPPIRRKRGEKEN